MRIVSIHLIEKGLEIYCARLCSGLFDMNNIKQSYSFFKYKNSLKYFYFSYLLMINKLEILH